MRALSVLEALRSSRLIAAAQSSPAKAILRTPKDTHVCQLTWEVLRSQACLDELFQRSYQHGQRREAWDGGFGRLEPVMGT